MKACSTPTNNAKQLWALLPQLQTLPPQLQILPLQLQTLLPPLQHPLSLNQKPSTLKSLMLFSLHTSYKMEPPPTSFKSLQNYQKNIYMQELSHQNKRQKNKSYTNTSPPFGKIYSMYKIKLQALKDYLNDMLVKGFIHLLISAAGASLLFAKKKSRSL
ncbi:hypothetical protein C0989_004603 [Termitomyces sp. Mn162]|nr:hypothetical protein C0989_004603 [Termitomyces sp. Mn162]